MPVCLGEACDSLVLVSSVLVCLVLLNGYFHSLAAVLKAGLPKYTDP